MDQPVRRTVVVSAVSLRKGGTLTVLRRCLAWLSTRNDLKVTAIVHDKSLCEYPGIDYIEIPWAIKSWGRRLWCEYVTLHKVSLSLGHIDLWLSLHDTSPRVVADRQAVYCHTSFPFMKVRSYDFRMDPKIPLFAMFTKWAYRWNSKSDDWLVVQQQWFREGLSKLVGAPQDRIVVAPPKFIEPDVKPVAVESDVPVFFYPSTPDCHKNFELACAAASLLESRIGKGKFKLVLTIKGDENRYASWLHAKWGTVDSIDFHGFMSKDTLYGYYKASECLLFPSRIETWGLPISEYMTYGGHMILADLPYAHETSAGAESAAFCDIDDPSDLSRLMQEALEGVWADFHPVPRKALSAPSAGDWDELFEILMK